MMPHTPGRRASCRTLDTIEAYADPAELLPCVRPFEVRPMPAVRQEFPEKKPQADIVTPHRAPGAARLQDARVGDSRGRVARHIDDAAAWQRDVVRHTVLILPAADDDAATRSSFLHHIAVTAAVPALRWHASLSRTHRCACIAPPLRADDRRTVQV